MLGVSVGASNGDCYKDARPLGWCLSYAFGSLCVVLY